MKTSLDDMRVLSTHKYPSVESQRRYHLPPDRLSLALGQLPNGLIPLEWPAPGKTEAYSHPALYRILILSLSTSCCLALPEVSECVLTFSFHKKRGQAGERAKVEQTETLGYVILCYAKVGGETRHMSVIATAQNQGSLFLQSSINCI
jgi:hypothetical protein